MRSTAQLLLAGLAPPQMTSLLGWDLAAARVAADADANATAAALGAFNLTLADLTAFQAALAGAPPAASGSGPSAPSGLSGALTAALGLDSPALDAALRQVATDPLNGTTWTAAADAALAAAVTSLMSNATASGNASAASALTLGAVLGYNGPLPIPSFDEFVAVHLLLRGLFSRFAPAWAAYRAVKDQTGVNPLGNLLELGGVAFVPDTPEVARMAGALAAQHVFWSRHYRGAHADVASARVAAEGDDAVVGPWAVVVFDEVSPAALRYTIRMRFTLIPGTDRVAARFYKGVGSGFYKYYTSGFLSLQRALDEAMLSGAVYPLNGTAASAGATRMVWGTPFPAFPFIRNSFYDSAGPLLGLVMCLSMIYPLGMLLKSLVDEKETGARELMRISGLREWALATAWALTYVVLFIAVAIAATIVLVGSVFPHCSAVVLFGMLFLFMLSIIPLAFLIACFFSRARLAAIFGPNALFVLVLPRFIFFRTSEAQSLGGKRTACLLSPTAFTFAADVLAAYESGNAGVTVANVWDGALSVGECMGWMVFDTALYAALAWYLDKVVPGAVGRGTPLPCWFLFTRSYWRGTPPLAGALPAARDVEAGAPAAADLEPAQEGGAAVVIMRGLRKQFSNSVVAVAGLDLTLYDNQITALLGHNGAGKSTVISMLTGLLPPSAGGISVCGWNMGTNLGAVRGLLGVCPQHNVLFPLLTVQEHLRLYATLKGHTGRKVTRAVDALLHEVGLQDKAHAAASALSGGMKRRLQLACALVGGSRVIILDEPSSGIDPVSRRHMWALLRRVRHGRCVLLTTHYLDEADLLADRVAILSEGRLRAAGSPLFLKQRLGGGFTLSVTADGPGAPQDALGALVEAHAPGATLLRAAGGETGWQLPPAVRGGVSSLLAALERDRGTLRIGGFSVAMATLEEVFLRLADEAPATRDAADFAAGGSGPVAPPGASLEMMQLAEQTSRRQGMRTDGVASWLPGLNKSLARGPALLEHRTDSAKAEEFEPREAPAGCVPQDLGAPAEPTALSEEDRTHRRAFREMMRKRALIARRDYKSVLSQVALPVAAVALVLLILKLDLDPTGPSLLLSTRALAALSSNATPSTPVWYPAQADAEGFARGFSASPSLRLVPVGGADARNSTTLSYALLQLSRSEPPFRYGAYVPADPVLPRVSPAVCLASATPTTGGAVGAALLAIAASRSGQPATVEQLQTSVLAGASALRATQELAPPALNILHNTSSSHALPIFLAELHAAQLQRVGGPALSVSSYPLPLTRAEVTTLQTFLKLLASFFFLIPFSYLPATYAAFVVRERAAGAKMMQLSSGCGAVSYWLAAYAWEMLNHLAVTLLCMLLFAIFQIDILIGRWDKGLGSFLLLLLYGLAVTPLSFVYSFLFDSHASAQVAIACANFITGFCLVNASFIMSVTPTTVALNAKLVQCFRIFPAFCLGEGLIALATSSFDFGNALSSSGAGGANSTYTAAAGAAPQNGFGDFVLGGSKGAFQWSVLGRPLLLLFAESGLFTCATLLIELRGRRMAAAVAHALAWPLQRLRPVLARLRPPAAPAAPPHAPDPEVEAERARVQAAPSTGDAVEIRGLRKVYPPRGAAPAKVALQDLWLGIKAGERFGLLGANGAGKTTTLSILCCDAAPTAGDALVGDASVRAAPAAVQRRIGYCPQRDPLLDLLTVREHLHLYARLKGLPERAVAAAAEATWRRVGLGPFADRLAGTLSGGNKRKLSLAIAIIGSPAVLLCDEPSSGMDAMARRHLWDTISSATAGMAVVITTHAMDEAEALCSRIGIMADGALRCLGSAAMLKDRYGDGHSISAKACAGQADALAAHLAAGLPGALCAERHDLRLRFAVPRSAGLSLSRLFAVLEAAPAEDWSISQSSLEAVFVAVAGGAADAADAGAEAAPPQPAALTEP